MKSVASRRARRRRLHQRADECSRDGHPDDHAGAVKAASAFASGCVSSQLEGLSASGGSRLLSSRRHARAALHAHRRLWSLSSFLAERAKQCETAKQGTEGGGSCAPLGGSPAAKPAGGSPAQASSPANAVSPDVPRHPPPGHRRTLWQVASRSPRTLPRLGTLYRHYPLPDGRLLPCHVAPSPGAKRRPRRGARTAAAHHARPYTARGLRNWRRHRPDGRSPA